MLTLKLDPGVPLKEALLAIASVIEDGVRLAPQVSRSGSLAVVVLDEEHVFVGRLTPGAQGEVKL